MFKKFFIIIFATLVLAGCTAANNINNIAPIDDQADEQAITNDTQSATSSQEIKQPEANNQKPPIIGGQKDGYGCLTPAGYSYDAEIIACIRNWELDTNQRKAAKIAIEYFGAGYSLTVIGVKANDGEGNYMVTLDSYGNRSVTELVNWQVK